MTKKDSLDEALEAGFAEPAKGGKFKLAQAGDWIRGKFLGSKPFEGEYGPTTIWLIEAEAGSYHENDCGTAKEPMDGGAVTELVAGEEYGLFDGQTFHDQIKQAEVGQRVFVKFVDRVESTKRKGKWYKNIRCGLDKAFVKAPPVDGQPF